MATNNKPEEISVEFTDPSKSNITPFTLDNWTSYSFDSDFFVPTDGFSLELADDRVANLINKIAVGDPINLLINGSVQSNGFIEKIDLDYSRGGTVLKISGRDKFGVVCDATTTPEIKINPTDTYLTAILKVLSPFGFTEEMIMDVSDPGLLKEADEIYVGGGGRQGIGKHSKSGRLSARSLKNQIEHQIKPNKNEGYMEYLHRISQRCGWQIKLYPSGNQIWVGPPLYDRDKSPLYKLQHYGPNPQGVAVPNQNFNNVIDGKLAIDWSKQPSIIIGEASSSGGTHRKAIAAVVMANDITAYDETINLLVYFDEKIKDLREYGFKVVSSNSALIKAIPRNLGSISYTSAQAKQRPNFIYDDEAKTTDELEFFVRRKMAEFNNSFLSVHYRVDGHTNNNAIWQINTLCHVTDDTFKLNGNYWIQRRTFTKSRGGGTHTDLVLKLPYVFDF